MASLNEAFNQLINKREDDLHKYKQSYDDQNKETRWLEDEIKNPKRLFVDYCYKSIPCPRCKVYEPCATVNDGGSHYECGRCHNIIYNEKIVGEENVKLYMNQMRKENEKYETKCPKCNSTMLIVSYSNNSGGYTCIKCNNKFRK